MHSDDSWLRAREREDMCLRRPTHGWMELAQLSERQHFALFLPTWWVCGKRETVFSTCITELHKSDKIEEEKYVHIN